MDLSNDKNYAYFYHAKNYSKAYLCHLTEFMIFCSLYYRYVNKTKQEFRNVKKADWNGYRAK